MADRYQDAGEVARDLKRFDTGKLVKAHDYSKAALVGRWIQVLKSAVQVGTVMAFIILVGSIVSFTRVASERDNARAQELEAVNSRGELEDLLGFMVTDLKKRLDDIGRLDVLAIVAGRVGEYFEGRPIDWKQPNFAHRRAIALQNLGRTHLATGNTAGAERNYKDELEIYKKLVLLEPQDKAQQG